MPGVWQDLRFSLRSLARQKGFTFAVAAALALGIGANTLMFSVVKGLLLTPPPFASLDRLVFLFSNQQQMGLSRTGASHPDYLDWKKRSQSFEDMGAASDENVNLTGSGEPLRLAGARVSASCLTTLGIQPVAGRLFRKEEEHPGNNRVAILGYPLWQNRFGGSGRVIGQRIALDGVPFTVIGIMPPRVEFPGRREIWLPMTAVPEDEDSRGRRGIAVVGRLRPGVTLARSRAEMEGIAAAIAHAHPTTNDGWKVLVNPLHEEYMEEVRPVLAALFGAVAFVLLIACANVANLVMVRFSGRRREIAIRAAIGAGRGRIVRQLLTESLLLALAGGALGIFPALWGIDLVRAFAAKSEAQLAPIRMDTGVLLFTLALSAVTGLLFGVFPAVDSSRTNLVETLKQGARGMARRSGLRNVLVVGEVALALMLLIGAGLMMETFLRLRAVRPGFNPEGVMTMQISLPPEKYKTDAQRADFAVEIAKRVGSLPGVTTAAVTSVLPLGGDDHGRGMFVVGRPDPPHSRIPIGYYRVVTPDYLRVLQIPLERGRFVAEADAEKAEPVVVINEKTAATLWPHEDALGKQIRFGSDQKANPPVRVVGIVGNVRHKGLREDAEAEIYLPYRQFPRRDLAIVARTVAAPQTVTGAVRAELKKMDPSLPLYNIRTMEELVAGASSDERLGMMLFGIFAALALVLAALGIYSVMAYTVSQRTAEIGVRIALGSSASRVLRLVVGRGLVLVCAGIGAGLAGALALTRLLGGLLYGVSPTEPRVFAGVVVVLVLVAVAANYIPAYRASRLDPVAALRQE